MKKSELDTKKVYIFFASNFEEIEALTVVDILRRSDIQIKTVSITGAYDVKGAHDILIHMDSLFDKNDFSDGDMLVLPGGPGTPNLEKHDGLKALIQAYYEKKKWLAAICAAPTVYGKMGLLKDKKATCYPEMEKELFCKKHLTDSVVVDGNIITSRGIGTAIDFSLKLVEVLKGKKEAELLAQSIVYETN